MFSETPTRPWLSGAASVSCPSLRSPVPCPSETVRGSRARRRGCPRPPIGAGPDAWQAPNSGGGASRLAPPWDDCLTSARPGPARPRRSLAPAPAPAAAAPALLRSRVVSHTSGRMGTDRAASQAIGKRRDGCQRSLMSSVSTVDFIWRLAPVQSIRIPVLSASSAGSGTFSFQTSVVLSALPSRASITAAAAAAAHRGRLRRGRWAVGGAGRWRRACSRRRDSALLGPARTHSARRPDPGPS